MPQYRLVSITLAEVRWTGRWCVVDRDLEVQSAYGWAFRPLGRRKPEALARELLLEILQAKLAQLEARGAETQKAPPAGAEGAHALNMHFMQGD